MSSIPVIDPSQRTMYELVPCGGFQHVLTQANALGVPVKVQTQGGWRRLKTKYRNSPRAPRWAVLLAQTNGSTKVRVQALQGCITDPKKLEIWLVIVAIQGAQSPGELPNIRAITTPTLEY